MTVVCFIIRFRLFYIVECLVCNNVTYYDRKKNENVKQFIEELNKFRSVLKTMTELLKVQIHPQAETVRPSDDTSRPENKTNETDGTIVQGLAKVNRKMHPDKVLRNEKEETIYQENTFYGSNMRNLISNIVTNCTNPSSQIFHESAFMKALADLDVPKDLVQNVMHLQMIKVYKNEKPQTMTLIGAERRKKWLSSTSRHR